MNRGTCSECVWWQHKERQEEVSPGGILMPRPSLGECRITAPRMQLWPCKDGNNWPRTEATDWCKEYLRRPEFTPCRHCQKPVGVQPFMFNYSLTDDGSFGTEGSYCCSANCAEQAELDVREYYKNRRAFKITNTQIKQVKL